MTMTRNNRSRKTMRSEGSDPMDSMLQMLIENEPKATRADRSTNPIATRIYLIRAIAVSRHVASDNHVLPEPATERLKEKKPLDKPRSSQNSHS